VTEFTWAKDREKAVVDLAFVLAVFAAGSLSVPFMNPILRRGHGVAGALFAAAYQFTLEGLAPLIMMLVRRERASKFGLIRRNLSPSLGFALAFAAIYDVLFSLSRHRVLWLPLARQPAVRMSLAASPLSALVGLTITVLVWGAAEGLFGVYISQKLATATRTSRRGWFAPGVLGYAGFNGAIHLIVGEGLEGFTFSFLSGYAIAVIPSVTGNAWGSLAVQTLTNAVGR